LGDFQALKIGSPARSIFILSFVVLLLAFSLYNQENQNRNSVMQISVAAGSNSHEVVVIQLYEAIDQGTADMVQRGVQRAQADNASAVVIDMNTPGGELSDMLTMIGAINSSYASGIPVYTFVGNFSSAASAGSYVAEATDGIYMATEGTVIGPSTPYIIGGTTLEEDHVANYTDALMVGYATEHGRNATAALQMAEFNVAYTGAQAIQYHLVNGYSGSLTQTLGIINETGASVVTISEDITEQALSFLSNGTVDGILLILGIVAIALDFFHPTFVLSVAGAVLIVLAIIGAEVIQGFSTSLLLPITFFAAAAALIIFEVKTGHGFFLFAGVVVGAIGTIFFAYDVPYSPSPVGTIQYVEVGLIIFVGAILAIYARYIGSTIRKKPVTGRESLVGKDGKVFSDISPTTGGEVTIDGVVWRAMPSNAAGGPIPKGEAIVVNQVKGLTLLVDRKP
jgi:membrane-bound serine protease (ClpP class)